MRRVKESFRNYYLPKETEELLLDWLTDSSISSKDYGKRVGETLHGILDSLRMGDEIDGGTIQNFIKGLRDSL